MAMTLEQEREAFEKWLTDGDTNPEAPPRDKRGNYVDADVRDMWRTWQARAHLTQPTQAVDVGAIAGVAEWLANNSHHITGAAEQADKLTRALSAEKAEWRDIATAPKDGTRVLVAYSVDGAGEIDGAMWCEPDEVWMLSDGFLCVGESEPTHWMPLPTPPTDGEE